MYTLVRTSSSRSANDNLEHGKFIHSCQSKYLHDFRGHLGVLEAFVRHKLYCLSY